MNRLGVEVALVTAAAPQQGSEKMTGQLEFGFGGREEPRADAARGYEAFVESREKALRELEARYGLILNKQVRLRLRGWDEEFKGKLVLNQLLVPANRKEALRLRIGFVTFDYADIEMCCCEPEQGA